MNARLFWKKCVLLSILLRKTGATQLGVLYPSYASLWQIIRFVISGGLLFTASTIAYIHRESIRDAYHLVRSLLNEEPIFIPAPKTRHYMSATVISLKKDHKMVESVPTSGNDVEKGFRNPDTVHTILDEIVHGDNHILSTDLKSAEEKLSHLGTEHGKKLEGHFVIDESDLIGRNHPHAEMAQIIAQHNDGVVQVNALNCCMPKRADSSGIDNEMQSIEPSSSYTEHVTTHQSHSFLQLHAPPASHIQEKSGHGSTSDVLSIPDSNPTTSKHSENQHHAGHHRFANILHTLHLDSPKHGLKPSESYLKNHSVATQASEQSLAKGRSCEEYANDVTQVSLLSNGKARDKTTNLAATDACTDHSSRADIEVDGKKMVLICKPDIAECREEKLRSEHCGTVCKKTSKVSLCKETVPTGSRSSDLSLESAASRDMSKCGCKADKKICNSQQCSSHQDGCGRFPDLNMSEKFEEGRSPAERRDRDLEDHIKAALRIAVGKIHSQGNRARTVISTFDQVTVEIEPQRFDDEEPPSVITINGPASQEAKLVSVVQKGLDLALSQHDLTKFKVALDITVTINADVS